MFEKASRMKLRFDTSKGLLTVEDLWDLPLVSGKGGPNLDGMAIALNRELKDVQTESFVYQQSKFDEILQLKFDLVKHIIGVKLAENIAAKDAADRKARKERLLEIIARKQDQQLEGASLEDLQKMVNEL